jgi:flavin-dependent dehydrogenase
MTGDQSVDVAVLGAGPAGSTAAIRLLALGHQVALVERREFPRSRIGEALSPGVLELLRFLELGDALIDVRTVRNVPTRIVWEQRDPELVELPQHRGVVVVDRAEFDADTLARSAAY